jgi:hypothetical protein
MKCRKFTPVASRASRGSLVSYKMSLEKKRSVMPGQRNRVEMYRWVKSGFAQRYTSDGVAPVVTVDTAQDTLSGPKCREESGSVGSRSGCFRSPAMIRK